MKNQVFKDTIADPDIKLGRGKNMFVLWVDLKPYRILRLIIAHLDDVVDLGQGGTELYSKDYCLLSGDLREFEHSIVPKLKTQGLDTR